MNILLNKLPESVTIDKIEYTLNSDYQTGIKFEMLMMDSSISYMDKIMKALILYYPIIPNNIEQAMEKLLWFYSCGIEQVEQSNKKSSSSNEQVFSYEQDQFLIYTAFFQYYHIDLTSIEHLHWWKFKQLFHELPDDSKMKKVMMYRSVKLNGNMSKEQKQFYAEMKVIYQLKDTRTEKQKATAFASILAGGMNIAKEIQR